MLVACNPSDKLMNFFQVVPRHATRPPSVAPWLPRVFVRPPLLLLRRHPAKLHPDEKPHPLSVPHKHASPGPIQGKQNFLRLALAFSTTSVWDRSDLMWVFVLIPKCPKSIYKIKHLSWVDVAPLHLYFISYDHTNVGVWRRQWSSSVFAASAHMWLFSDRRSYGGGT